MVCIIYRYPRHTLNFELSLSTLSEVCIQNSNVTSNMTDNDATSRNPASESHHASDPQNSKILVLDELELELESESSPENEQQQQIKVLLQSLNLVARLAAMDTETYSRTCALVIGMKDPDDLNNAAVLQQRLDGLQRQWKLETTAFPRLLDSIHRLHSTCIHLESHSDQITLENEALEQQHAAATNRIKKLEAAVQKFHNKNGILNQKLHAEHLQKQSLVKNVRNYVRDFHKQEMQVDQDRLASQLQAHERIMMAGIRTRTSSQDMLGNRSRTSSRDTTFSDVDVAAMYQLTEEEFGPDLNDNHSVVSSVSSVTSMVTDDGIASLRLESFGTDDVVLHYPADSKVGIQFHRMQLQSNQGVLNDPHDIKDSKVSSAGLSGLQFKLDSFLGVGKKEESTALFVFGHVGFDDSLNCTRPLVGSRLVAVNGKRLDEGASTTQIRNMSQGNPFTLSFRVVPLTAKQKKELLENAGKTTTHSIDPHNDATDTENVTRLQGTNDRPKADNVTKSESQKADTPEHRKLESEEISAPDALAEGTTPAVKLRKQMKSVGMKFKSLF